MMKSWLRSLNPIAFESTVQHSSRTHSGVRFAIRRMSLGRRIELAESIRGLAQELECRQAGQTSSERVEAASISARIELAYLRWGLVSVSGIFIDSEPATADSLYARGPEDLFREIVDSIKSECGLSEDDRKN